MNYYGKAQEVAERIVESFKTGELPKALATVFIRRKDGVPCRSWSWGNQLLCVLNGTSDARGIRQWNSAERFVKKGSQAFAILVPLLKEIAIRSETGQEEKISVLRGFKTAPVFAVESTEGKELPKQDEEITQWLNSLPLIEVARQWGIKVEVFDGKQNAPQGKFSSRGIIALGVKNLSTWAHELIHAADFRLGNLSERGQHWRSETVAELGSAILLEALGLGEHADRGGSFKYIESYAAEADKTTVQACMDVINRTCEAVNLLLAEAGKLALTQQVEAA